MVRSIILKLPYGDGTELISDMKADANPQPLSVFGDIIYRLARCSAGDNAPKPRAWA